MTLGIPASCSIVSGSMLTTTRAGMLCATIGRSETAAIAWKCSTIARWGGLL